MARRPPKQDDHVCPAIEAYLMTYADMITALLVLFIVLFAMGQIDLVKFEKFKQGIARSGATPIDDGLLEDGDGVFEQAIVRPEVINSVQDSDGPGGEGGPAGSEAQEQLEQTQADVAQALQDAAIEGVELGSDLSFRVETRGLIITILSDAVLFEPGSASLTDSGDRVVAALGSALGELPNRLTVEGHTDSRPISTSRFPSNWELSTGRSSSVLRALVERYGLDPRKVNASGYADQRPIGDNATPEGRAANRRVEIVVHNVEAEPEPTFGEGA